MNTMNNQLETTTPEKQTVQNADAVIVDANDVDNAVLKRLIEEVQNEGINYVNAYNRTHSRHNRGR